MRNTIMLLILALLLAYTGYSQKRYAGRKHTSSHGGTYRGGKGSSHKGGHYTNRSTGNHYGKHKK